MTPGDALEALDVILRSRRFTSAYAGPVDRVLGYTDAYGRLQLAWGHARLGNAARSRALVALAEAELAPVQADPIHAYLLAAFRVRIAGYDGVLHLCDALAAPRAGLDRTGRYKVDRLREASRILSPLETIDAFDQFVAKREDHASPLAAVALAERPAAIADALGTFAVSRELLEDALEVLIGVEARLAAPTFARVFDEIQDLPPANRAQLYAKAMAVADLVGLIDVRTLAFDRARTELVHAPDRADVLDVVVPLARKLDLRRELAELVMTLELLPAPTSSREEVLLAGCRAALGGSASAAVASLDVAIALRQEPASSATGAAARGATELAAIRSITLATACLPVDVALPRLVALGDLLVDMTDDLGTSSHYGWLALGFLDALVIAIVSCGVRA